MKVLQAGQDRAVRGDLNKNEYRIELAFLGQDACLGGSRGGRGGVAAHVLVCEGERDFASLVAGVQQQLKGLHFLSRFHT